MGVVQFWLVVNGSDADRLKPRREREVKFRVSRFTNRDRGAIRACKDCRGLVPLRAR